ncbi:MAG: phosphotransferase [Pyrinomonadaceae bacterium]|nr:phosphotransferase [Pyrinomonadaceae bacterium]
MSDKQLLERFNALTRDWRVVVEDTLETHSSFVAFGWRGAQPVVLKVVRNPGDEWLCGEVLEAFDAEGMVRVYEHVAGAALMERLSPATPLVNLSLAGRDEEATEIMAEVMARISHPGDSLESFTTVETWGRAFQLYLESNDSRIPKELVEEGQQVYFQLCATQRARRLLHGDLQHYNVLFDSARGWVAIDPKGVVGEIEYEVGASLRNPYERPSLFASPAVVSRRLRRYEESLKLDSERALRWSFAQAVLSAVWSIEDKFSVDDTAPALMLANALRPML